MGFGFVPAQGLLCVGLFALQHGCWDPHRDVQALKLLQVWNSDPVLQQALHCLQELQPFSLDLALGVSSRHLQH